MLTQQYIQSLFDYKDGQLVRKTTKSTRCPVGSVAGYQIASNNHWLVGIDDEIYPLASLVWLWHYGEYVLGLDHKDQNPSNNNISNLRKATITQNNCNRAKNKRNATSIFKGVSWSKYRNKWIAHIQHKGKQRHLGFFVLEQDAAEAYNKKAIELHGEFAVLN